MLRENLLSDGLKYAFKYSWGENLMENNWSQSFPWNLSRCIRIPMQRWSIYLEKINKQGNEVCCVLCTIMVFNPLIWVGPKYITAHAANLRKLVIIMCSTAVGAAPQIPSTHHSMLPAVFLNFLKSFPGSWSSFCCPYDRWQVPELTLSSSSPPPKQDGSHCTNTPVCACFRRENSAVCFTLVPVVHRRNKVHFPTVAVTY